MSAKGSELKRVRQSRKANSYNNHYKSMMKTAIKNVLVVDMVAGQQSPQRRCEAHTEFCPVRTVFVVIDAAAAEGGNSAAPSMLSA